MLRFTLGKTISLEAALLLSLAVGFVSPALANDSPRAVVAERERLIELYRQEGADAVPALVEALDTEQALIRRTAAHLLARLGEPALEGVEKALEHPDFQVRRIAIHGLREMGLLLDYWRRILTDDHPSIRQEAQRVLVLDEQIARAGDILEERPILHFDGEDSYVEAEERANLGSADFTYEIWFKPYEMDAGTQGLMGSGRGDNPERRGINLRYNRGGEINFRAANRNDSISLAHRAVIKDQWMHVAAVLDREGQAKLYLNGVPVGEADATGFGDDDGFDAGPFRVGRRPHSNIWHFHGKIAEVRVWRRARAQTEILDTMTKELSGDEEGLLLYWPMDEGEGDIVRDRTEHQINGQIEDGTWQGQ